MSSLGKTFPFNSKWYAKKKKKKVQLTEKINKISIYLNVNRVPIIHYEPIFKICILYSKIYVNI